MFGLINPLWLVPLIPAIYAGYYGLKLYRRIRR